jgi:hypothetical protein
MANNTTTNLSIQLQTSLPTRKTTSLRDGWEARDGGLGSEVRQERDGEARGGSGGGDTSWWCWAAIHRHADSALAPSVLFRTERARAWAMFLFGPAVP